MRFILTYSGQRQYSNYAQIMVRMDDQRGIAPVTRHVEDWIARNYPQVNASTKRIMFGPPEIARLRCALRAQTRIAARAGESGRRISPRTRRPTACVRLAEPQQSDPPAVFPGAGTRAGVDKQDIDNALEMNFSGSRAGLYREGPICCQ